MAFWNALFGGRAPPPRSASFPLKVEALPGLHVNIFRHDLAGSVPCWTYVSEGLADIGWREVCFTIRILDGENPADWPREPVELVRAFNHFVARGQLVNEGGITQFGSKLPFNRHLLYAPAWPLDGVAVPEDALQALFVTPAELNAARAYGPARLQARWGEAQRFFPYPPWLDRNGNTAFDDRLDAGSILAGVFKAVAPGLTVTVESGTVVLRIRSRGAAWLRNALPTWPEDLPVALFAQVDRKADSCLVWDAVTQERRAIAAPGSTGGRMAGNFVLLSTEPDGESARHLEDGFAVLFGPREWRALRAALLDGHDYSFPGGDGLGFAVRWPDRSGEPG